MRSSLFGFLFAMWGLIIIGGAIAVLILGPISVSGYGNLDWTIASTIKGAVALILVITWILILSKLKNWIFRKEIRF